MWWFVLTISYFYSLNWSNSSTSLLPLLTTLLLLLCTNLLTLLLSLLLLLLLFARSVLLPLTYCTDVQLAFSVCKFVEFVLVHFVLTSYSDVCARYSSDGIGKGLKLRSHSYLIEDTVLQLAPLMVLVLRLVQIDIVSMSSTRFALLLVTNADNAACALLLAILPSRVGTRALLLLLGCTERRALTSPSLCAIGPRRMTIIYLLLIKKI